MPFVHLPSGKLHYLDRGQGTPLLLLSANPGDARDFEAVLPALAAHYRVLALDWPGYGESPVPDDPQHWSGLRFYGVLREFIQALQLPPVLLVGNSVGGNAAARLAIEAPEQVRGLVLIAPGGFTPHNLVTRSFCRLMGSRLALPPRWWAGLYLRRRTPTVRAMLERAAGPQSAPGRLALNRALWRSFAVADNDLRERATALKAPTLLLFGRRDPAIPAHRDGRIAARCLPQARFVALDCGHACQAELPEAFLAETLPFLQRCTLAVPVDSVRAA